MIKEQDIRKQTVEEVARKMMVAARTAPKGKGIDNLEIALADSDDVKQIATRMKEIGARANTTPAFLRDADNILKAEY